MAPQSLLIWDLVAPLRARGTTPWRHNAVHFGFLWATYLGRERYHSAEILAYSGFCHAPPERRRYRKTRIVALLAVKYESRLRHITEPLSRTRCVGMKIDRHAQMRAAFAVTVTCCGNKIDVVETLTLLDLQVISFPANSNRCWSFLGLFVKSQKSWGQDSSS